MVNAKDSDYTNRLPVGEDPNTLDHTIAQDGGVPFSNRSYTFPYLYDETSHELLFSSSLSGPFNFIGGLFTYENNLHWQITWNDYHAPYRFGTADELAAAASPIYGFIPVSSCQDVLSNVVGPIWGLPISPEEAAVGGFFISCPLGSEQTESMFFSSGSSDTKAAFFSGDYQFNEHWTLSGGLRYTEDEKEQRLDGQGYYVRFGVEGAVVAYDTEGSGEPDLQTWSAPIGHLSLEYTTDSGNLIYGRISTGYRAGGFNTQVLGLEAPFIEEETLINYELGMKGLFLNSRLQLQGGLWYNDFDGYQFNAVQELPPGLALPPDVASPLIEFTDNIDGTKIWGADIEASYWMADHWRLSGFYAYQDSELGPHSSVLRGNPDAVWEEWEYIDFNTGQLTTAWYETATDQTGNRLPMQPEHKLALTLGYEHELGSAGNAGSFQFLTTYAYTGEMFADIGNLPIYELPAYDRWDAGATWTAPDRAWSVTLFVQNITDEIGIVEFVPQSTNGGFTHLAVLTQPRQYGLQLRWRPF
jgi:outer membrane receptor protein involved in Fe transport